jgi:hypothetical protein
VEEGGGESRELEEGDKEVEGGSDDGRGPEGGGVGKEVTTGSELLVVEIGIGVDVELLGNSIVNNSGIVNPIM